MTYPAPISVRPGVVTAAVALLMVSAAALLTDAIALIVGAGEYPARVREVIQRSEVDPQAAEVLVPFARFASIAAIAITLIAAAVLIVLAALVARRSFAARVVTWVAIGFALLCNLCGIGSAGAGFSGLAYVTAYSRDSSGTHTFAQRLPAGYPDWYRPLSLGLALVCFAALATACVLLALPAANAYFRKPAPMIVPVLAPVPLPPAGGWMVPGNPGPISPDQGTQLAELNRKYQRGELTNEQHLAEQDRILGRG